jgi:hypothetical protein
VADELQAWREHLDDVGVYLAGDAERVKGAIGNANPIKATRLALIDKFLAGLGLGD